MGLICRTCPHCSTGHVAFSIIYSATIPNVAYSYNNLASCGACQKPISFQARRTGAASGPQQHVGDIEPAWDVQEVWPQIIEIKAPRHTPEAVQRRFIEGEEAFRRGSWNAAAAMYRSALDIATKAIDEIPKGTFFRRLEWLHEQHRITPDMKNWADHVRIEGNEALHDPDDFTEDDTKPLRLFTEMFLRYLFELPGEVRAFRARSELPGGG